MLLVGLTVALWLGLLPLATAGTAGVVLVLGAQTLLLVSAGAFNSTFATYRMAATEDGHLSRVLAANPEHVESYRSGKQGLLGFFVGQVMKETEGRANPKLVNDLLREKLDA